MFFDSALENLLSDLEKSSNKHWNVSRDIGMLLFWLVKNSAVQNVLEIGTSSGYSTLYLARALWEKGAGKVLTVESNAGRYEIAQKTFTQSGMGEVIELVKGHAPEIFAETSFAEKSFDFVFMDATKEEYLSCFLAMQGLLAKKAMIVADNVLSHPVAVKNFLEEVRRHEGWRMEILPFGKGLAVLERG